MDETTELPPRAACGRGLNVLMMLGAVMCVAAFVIAVMALNNQLPAMEHPYLVAAALLVAGSTGFRFGRAIISD